MVNFDNTPENAREILGNLGRNIDFSFYNLEVFNQCEHENALLMAVPQWEGVHPLLKILPVEWNHSIPFGLLHSPTPSPTVKKLIRTVAQVMNAQLQVKG